MMYETEQLLEKYNNGEQHQLVHLLRAIMKEVDELRNEIETAQTTADDAYDMAQDARNDIDHLTIVRR